jgi:LmbE family N-acetylglucosaminyl deacetylase
MRLHSLPAALVSLALFSTLVAPAQQATSIPAQSAQFTDPANLRGERVKPRDGRELPIDQGARGLEQMLRRLNTRASLMLIVAHPDDEDGGMLTYYSRGLGARVAVLTLTRGEGGQNAMTGDFEDALGLLRTQELLSADRYLGVDQFFGTEVDFGFSKTKEEAFKKWTHERVLYDAVRSIRLYRPLVIAAVFIGGVTDGHGQHQVSGQIAQEAFKAAADPTVFPDMIAEGILPWQALKVYARIPMQSISDKGLFDYATGKYTAPCFENYVTGEVTTTVPSSDVIVHEGTTDPILSDNPSDPPRNYVQFARIGLGMQKSQIGGGVRVPPAGAFDVAYHRYGSKLANQPQHEASFFDGIDTSVEGIGSLVPNAPALISDPLRIIKDDIDVAQKSFDPTHPEKTADHLASALQTLDLFIRGLKSIDFPPEQKQSILHELLIKRVQLNDALLLAYQIDFYLEPTEELQRPDVQILTTDKHLDLPIEFRNGDAKEVKYLGGRLLLSQGTASALTTPLWPFPDPLVGRSERIGQQLKADIPQGLPATRPYFSRPNIEQPFYDLSLPNLRNAPSTPIPLVAELSFDHNGVKLYRQIAIVHFSGPQEDQPQEIVPPVGISISPRTQLLLQKSDPRFSIQATLNKSTATLKVKTKLTGPKDWQIGPYPSPSDSESFFNITPPHIQQIPEVAFTASAFVTAGATYTEGYRPIGYGDLPRTNYYTPATVRIVPVDLNLPTKEKIAYLPGTGDAVPEALASINLKPEILTVADLTPAKLSHYDTVILGVRTYNAHPDLHGAPTQALLDYARNGGNVLVQYQTAEFTAADAPYPLTLGYAAEKVVDETDPVQLLDPAAPFLTTPNKINPADFNNWVEERGHGFLGSWDPHYTALTETHDPDQDPQRGGLITTSLGKGRWTYCAFALYRQLPEAVPGAFRLFVNLITARP